EEEDIVVLRWPALRRARAVVVRPDDLVDERLASEDPIQEYLAVVHLAVVDVEVEASRRREHTMRLAQARLEEREVVVERIGDPVVRREPFRAIAASREPLSITLFVADGA